MKIKYLKRHEIYIQGMTKDQLIHCFVKMYSHAWEQNHDLYVIYADKYLWTFEESMVGEE